MDAVLEDTRGGVVGIEIKAGATLGGGDLKGLRTFAELTKDRFVRGIVLYGGRERLPLGERIEAVPLACLWSGEKLGASRRTKRSAG